MTLPGTPVRIAIVSRQEVVGRGLVAMLADFPDRVIVTSIPSSRSSALGVDVIVYDTMGLHGTDGSELRHLLSNTEAKILVFSRDMRPDLRAKALAMGCEAWISMTTRTKELVEAIECVAWGQPVPTQPERLGVELGLSPREVEIMAFITQGLSNQQIVEKLVLSENTVKSHIRRLYKKVGVVTRAQAVAWAMQHGFAPPDE